MLNVSERRCLHVHLFIHRFVQSTVTSCVCSPQSLIPPALTASCSVASDVERRTVRGQKFPVGVRAQTWCFLILLDFIAKMCLKWEVCLNRNPQEKFNLHQATPLVFRLRISNNKLWKSVCNSPPKYQLLAGCLQLLNRVHYGCWQLEFSYLQWFHKQQLTRVSKRQVQRNDKSKILSQSARVWTRKKQSIYLLLMFLSANRLSKCSQEN